MRLATIDLGTNAVRFDVYQVGRREAIHRLHRERWPVRLGEGVFESGVLSPAAMNRTIAAFRHFARFCREREVDRIQAYGTSALRTAENAHPFLSRLKDKTGISVEIISGAREARLIAEAVLRWEPRAKGAAVLVDIGGGSVEIVLGRNRKPTYSVSLDVGVSRLRQLFLKRQPPRRSPATGRHPVGELRRHLRRALWAASPRGGWPGSASLIVSGGTGRAVCRLEGAKKNGIVTNRAISKIVWNLMPLNRRQLLEVPGMDPRRVDLILPGAVLLDEIAQVFDAEKISPTPYGLREGMVLEVLKEKGLFSGLAGLLSNIL
jgi:exopolyphosphatase/guanosine-5'-triphosphate,3'-diphosphate pyrophosphatase